MRIRNIFMAAGFILTGCSEQPQLEMKQHSLKEVKTHKKSIDDDYMFTRKGISFVVTAYSPYDDVSGINSDGNPNKTATGTKPRPGTFAVDPNVIPYGSTIAIMYEDGTIERGVAEDTGGAIKNERIDVFRYTYKKAMRFGKREAVVIWNEGER